MEAQQLSLDFNLVAPSLPRAPKMSSSEVAARLVAIAREICSRLGRGERINMSLLSQLMSQEMGGSDASGRWQWKQAYDAVEIALVLFVRQQHRQFSTAIEFLNWLLELEALLPVHSIRCTESVELQQFSTPLPLGFCASLPLQVKAGDWVLEPSAGNGLLAVFAEIFGGKLVLNELHEGRRSNLVELFGSDRTFGHNAEYFDDYLDPSLMFSKILMNPPFSRSLHHAKRDPMAVWKHLRAALRRLEPGGRLSSIGPESFNPRSRKWKPLFGELGGDYRIVVSAAIEGKAYAKHGTSVTTRLTTFEKTAGDAGLIIDEPLSIRDLFDVLAPYIVWNVPALDETSSTSSEPKIFEAIQLEEIVDVTYALVGEERRERQREFGDLYEAYVPQRIRILDANPHPTPLVQSIAMASILPPVPTYVPRLPARTIREALSDAQLEATIYAGEAHSQFLDGYYELDLEIDTLRASNAEADGAFRLRRGFFIGDGTGLGKGREVASILLDNWHRGRRKAIWISKNETLLEDARRDWQAVGGRSEQIVPQSKYAFGSTIDLAEGIAFTTYAMLRIPARGGKTSRLEQLVEWVGRDSDGAIVFDEAHAMANATAEEGLRGVKKPSQQGLAGLRLQRLVPNARIVYVSATGATRLTNLSYAERLGLWSNQSEFPFRSRTEFLSQVGMGGIAALEVVSRELKALGLYMSRSVSFEGVAYEQVEVPLNEDQTDIYDRYAAAYQLIHARIEDALAASNVLNADRKALDGQARANAYSTFEGCKQRFFNHLLTSFKCAALIGALEADLEAGKAAVIQLISTDEALLNRRLAEIPAARWNDIEVDITPREYVFDYLRGAFPVQLYKTYTDEEGVERAQAVFDDKGDPVLCQEAIRLREALLVELSLLPPVPSALDLIIAHFGTENVAEVTGRSKRIVVVGNGEETRHVVQSRNASAANLAETEAFQSDRKRILFFSNAGGTGRSYHADRNCLNKRPRRHYLLEPGWQADTAIQGLGRTNRSNQAVPPTYILISTDVKGEKRFISTIARRLDSLGALTKGERKAGGQGLFRPEDNLESRYAKDALNWLFAAIARGSIDGWSPGLLKERMGLAIANDNDGLYSELPEMSRFLNRLLALPIALQNDLFSHLETAIESRVEEAIEAGIYDLGVETLQALRFRVLERKTVYRHRNGSTSEAIKIERTRKSEILSRDSALDIARARPDAMLCINDQSGRACVRLPAASRFSESGASIPRYTLIRPKRQEKVDCGDFDYSSWRRASEGEFCQAWDDEIASINPTATDCFFLIVGLLLPIWDRIDTENVRIYRLVTEEGERMLGRIVTLAEFQAVADSLGLEYRPSASDIVEAAWSAKGKPVDLRKGLKLCTARVMGKQRLEILGFRNPYEYRELIGAGAFGEIINHRSRVFVPADDRAVKVIARLCAETQEKSPQNAIRQTTPDIICAYTRRQAIEDGEQFCLSERFPDLCRSYRYPVYATRSVWQLVEDAVENPDFANDPKGVVWDIIYTSVLSAKRIALDRSTSAFDVIVTGASRKCDRREDGMPIYRLVARVGALDIDDASPCVTICFPDEL